MTGNRTFVCSHLIFSGLTASKKQSKVGLTEGWVTYRGSKDWMEMKMETRKWKHREALISWCTEPEALTVRRNGRHQGHYWREERMEKVESSREIRLDLLSEFLQRGELTGYRHSETLVTFKMNHVCGFPRGERNRRAHCPLELP